MPSVSFLNWILNFQFYALHFFTLASVILCGVSCIFKQSTLDYLNLFPLDTMAVMRLNNKLLNS